MYRLSEELLSRRCRTVVTAGFDGYVDSILRVRKQVGEDSDSYFATLSEFGRYIEAKSGRSCSLELKQDVEKVGGNMPIFALALTSLGVKVNCIGAAGYPEVLPLFSSIADKLISVCEPGKCEALEFDDGKLMLARNEDIGKLDFSVIEERAGLEAVAAVAEECDILAFLNWSELKGSSSIWRGFLDQILPTLSGKKRKLFIDLSDCAHRTASDITEAVEMMREFAGYAAVTLSLNRNEAECVASSLNIEGELPAIAKDLYDEIGCEHLIVHLVDGCYCVHNGKILLKRNRFVSKPKLSTGGGDNFNAGFVYAMAAGFPVEECMEIANTVSGYYVSHGRSPDVGCLAEWIGRGEDGKTPISPEQTAHIGSASNREV